MTHRPPPRKLLPGALLAVVAVVLLLVGTPFANGKFTTTVTNTQNTGKTAVYPCTAATLAYSEYLVYALDEPSGPTADDVSPNNRNGTYGPSGITYQTPGPCPGDGAHAITLNGSSGYVSGAESVTAPATFTEEIWFKTNTTTGGKLIGLGSSQTGQSGSYDRHIYMNNAGYLVFGVYPNTVKEVVSPSTYNDNKWHQAVASLAPSGTYVGMRLYVDGKQVVVDTAVTTAQKNYSPSYWRIGYDNLNGWGSMPSSFYFKGSLAYASIYTTALTPAQVLAQYNAGK